MFGASNAYEWNQAGCSDYPSRPVYLVEDVDEGYSTVTLQRHRGVHTLLRSQHLGEGVWELPGSYIDGHELCEEGILERWNTSASAGKPWFSGDRPVLTIGRHGTIVELVEMRH